MNKKITNSLVWFRRDLRLYDHNALSKALLNSKAVYCCFIFDTTILNGLKNKKDRRIDFIWNALKQIKATLKKFGSVLGDYCQTGCNSVLSPGSLLLPHSKILPCEHFRGTKTN